jgi:hypothetical protein
MQVEMQKVPKIVSDRLRATTSALGHPDPNLLTAFSERALPESERALVLEHLARCDDCRDVVALALPEIEVVENESLGTVRAGRPRWAVLRWGLVAASVVAVASVGVVQYRQTHHPPTMASITQPRSEVAAYTAQNSPAVRDAVTPQAQDREDRPPVSNLRSRSDGRSTDEKRDLGEVGLVQKKILGRAGAVGTFGDAVGGAAAASTFDRGPKLAANQAPKDLALANELKAPAPSLPKQEAVAELAKPAPGAYSQTVQVQSANAEVDAQNQNQNQNQNQAPDQLALNDLDALSERQVPIDKVDKAKPVVGGSVAGAGTALATPYEPPLPASGRLQIAGEPSTRWNIASDGALQRSLDEGKTWQNVRVSPSSSAVASSMELGYATNAKATKAKATNAAPATASPNPVFRAVVANGAEVWAGGSGGLLYHSVDAGSHWTPVVLKANSVALTGDITSVDFSDVKHGRVTTSTSEVWTTADGGASWQKQ